MRSLSKVLKHFDVRVGSSFYIAAETPVFDEDFINFKDERIFDRAKAFEQAKSFDQARTDAFEIIAEAEKTAQGIKLSMINKMKTELETAQKNGYEMGFNLGKEEALAQNQETLRELKNLLDTLDMQKTAIINDYGTQIRDLAISIAAKLINKEFDDNNEAFINIYKNAVKDFNNQEWIRITVSDYESEFVTANADLLTSMVKGAKYLDIVKLGGAPRGTCIVETAQGIIDASLEVQIERIREVFAEVGE